MPTKDTINAWVEEHLPALIATHNVPAASVSILRDGEIFSTAAGTLSLATGVEANVDSIFQVGSITKTWTTTLIMQLVDDGLLDLDAPVRDTLPEFTIADEAAAAAVTTRQLLSHTSGFEGDFFNDTGVGDDAVEKYLPTIADAPQLFAPGERFSYNNAAFVVLGRIIEVLRKSTFEQALRTHLLTPLGLTHVATSAAEAIMFRAAVGHLPTGDGDAVAPAPVWNLPRSNAPAGALLTMSSHDLVTYAQMHIADGVAADGTRVLSAASAQAMREAQVDVPDLGLMGDTWGLGWEIFNWQGGTVVGHDGGTIGQSAFLRIIPAEGVAVAILTNGGNALDLYTDLLTEIFGAVSAVTPPALPELPADAVAVNVDRILGDYSSSVSDINVRADEDGRIWLTRTMKGIFAGLGPAPEPVELLGWRGDSLLPKEATGGVRLPYAFVGDDGAGRALFIHSGRADRRVDA